MLRPIKDSQNVATKLNAKTSAAAVQLLSVRICQSGLPTARKAPAVRAAWAAVPTEQGRLMVNNGGPAVVQSSISDSVSRKLSKFSRMVSERQIGGNLKLPPML